MYFWHAFIFCEIRVHFSLPLLERELILHFLSFLSLGFFFLFSFVYLSFPSLFFFFFFILIAVEDERRGRRAGIGADQKGKEKQIVEGKYGGQTSMERHNEAGGGG